VRKHAKSNSVVFKISRAQARKIKLGSSSCAAPHTLINKPFGNAKH
jgi:hypothetical protein